MKSKLSSLHKLDGRRASKVVYDHDLQKERKFAWRYHVLGLSNCLQWMTHYDAEVQLVYLHPEFCKLNKRYDSRADKQQVISF